MSQNTPFQKLKSNRQLTTEVSALTRLHDASVRLWHAPDLQSGLNEILIAAIELLSADMGNVQLLNPNTNMLEIVAHQGFRKDFLAFFREVSTRDNSACGRSLRTKERIIIADVENDADYTPYRAIAKSAGYRAVQSTPLFRRDGSPLGMLSTHFYSPHRPEPDVLKILDLYVQQAASFIERFNIERRLQESEKRFRNMADVAPVFIGMGDEKGNAVYLNKPFLEFLGKSIEEIEQFGYTHLIHPDDLPRVIKEYQNALERHQPFTQEYRYLRNDGSYRWVWVSSAPRFSDDGTFVGYIGSHLDITERKVAEEAQARLAAIITSSDDAIISKTLQGVITSWNGGAERIFGYSAHEAIGHSITLIIPQELLHEETEILTKIRNGMRIDQYETVRMRKDGKRLHVSLTISPLKDQKGTIIGASKIARDITERVEQETRKDDFLNMTSHELKTPLTSLKMYLEVLSNAHRNGNLEKATVITEKIKEQTDKLKDLVNDLLDVARIKTGKFLLQLEHVFLNELIGETIETVQQTTNRHTITFHDGAAIALEADRFRLYQVLVNLLTNAIKYSPQGGGIIVSLQKDSTYALLNVQDFGIGIDKSQHEKIFEKLYQVPEAEEKTYPGLGMGLYIAKEIVDRHQGKLWVVSEKGKGATFYMALPLQKGE